MIQILDGILIFHNFSCDFSSFGYFMKNNVCYYDPDQSVELLNSTNLKYCLFGEWVKIISPSILYF